MNEWLRPHIYTLYELQPSYNSHIVKAGTYMSTMLADRKNWKTIYSNNEYNDVRPPNIHIFYLLESAYNALIVKADTNVKN